MARAQRNSPGGNIGAESAVYDCLVKYKSKIIYSTKFKYLQSINYCKYYRKSTTVTSYLTIPTENCRFSLKTTIALSIS